MTICLRKRKRSAQWGFTLIELFVFVVMIVCVVIGVKVAQQKFDFKFAGLLGGLLGFLFSFFGLMSYAALMHFIFGSGLPKCQDESCRGPGNFRGDGDYAIRKFGEEYNYVCKHGVRYMRRGKRFVIVNDDGTETPYLIWRPFRGWFPDAMESNHGS